MKSLLIYILICITSISYPKAKTWKSSTFNVIKYSLFNRMTFREPVVFTPLDIKIGYLYYGGKNYWSHNLYTTSDLDYNNSPILLDSTQYSFNSINSIDERKGLFIEVDFLKTNLTHFIFEQNYIDLQMGLGLQANYFSNTKLPQDTLKVWDINSSRGNYYLKPRSIGININTSLGWQLGRKRFTYIYHSIGISSISLYESTGGKRSLSGIGINESFGLGTKYIFPSTKTNFNYTLGIELKWSRMYMVGADAPKGLSPIDGIDMRAAGVFLTSGILFGGKHTDGDIAYSQMMHNDFISASENFKKFLAKETHHNKRNKALNMLQYCQSKIPYQKFQLAINAYLLSDFSNAIQYFNSAELDADDILKKEIQSKRKSFSSELLNAIAKHKNEISIAEAKILAQVAKALFPNLKQYSKVMGDLYMDKAKLNTKIKNYPGAIDIYEEAKKLYPELGFNIKMRLYSIADSLMKDAYFSYKQKEMYTVLNTMKKIIQLQPQIKKDLDPYIIKLEKQITQKNR